MSGGPLFQKTHTPHDCKAGDVSILRYRFADYRRARANKGLTLGTRHLVLFESF